MKEKLEWVGLEGVEMPLRHQVGRQAVLLPARADLLIGVDDPHTSSIHLSRLYMEAEQLLSGSDFNAATVSKLLHRLSASHSGLGGRSLTRFTFDLPVRRIAAASKTPGWKTYPIHLECEANNRKTFSRLDLQLVYSSTCPCSAEISRSLRRQAAAKAFKGKVTLPTAEVLHWIGSEAGLVASPHSQRSQAAIRLSFRRFADAFAFTKILDRLEKSLGTALLPIARKADEVEFSRTSALNLMFCEDACRRLVSSLRKDASVADFQVQVRHEESLHAYNAFASARR